MPKVKVCEEIGAPVGEVFDVFTDIERGAQRVSAINEIQLLTTGGFGLGTRWLETRDVLGRLDSAEMEVTAFDRHHGYTITHHKLGTRIDTSFAFEPSGAGTMVTIEFDLEAPGMPPGILAPLGWAIAGKVRDVISHDLADLRESAEHSETEKKLELRSRT